MLPDKRGSERLNQNLNMKCLFLNFGGFVNRRPKDTIYIYIILNGVLKSILTSFLSWELKS